MGVDLQIDSQLAPVPELSLAWLQTVLEAVEQITGDSRLRQVICVRLCDSIESQYLNVTYRGIDAPTNVLSFPADFDVPVNTELVDVAEVPLGDLAICWPVVCAEACEQQKTTYHHFTHLFVHGLLHLLGFDHIDDIPAQEMEALEVRILSALNISNPYKLGH